MQPTSVPPQAGSTDDTIPSPDAEARALQNVLEALVGQAVQNSRKRLRDNNDENSTVQGKENRGTEDVPVLQPDYNAYGRHLNRICDPFTKIDVIVQHGIHLETADSDIEAEVTPEHKRLNNSWSILCATIPKFRDNMVALAVQRNVRRSLCRQIGNGVEGSRADDTSRLKRDILHYLLLDPTALLTPIILPEIKTTRGWHHPVTARLLCPIEYEADEATYADIQAGVKPVTAAQLPRFLFPDGQVFDEDAFGDNIMRGHLILRVAKHIFVGPSAALQGPGFHRGRSGNAAINGMTAMTPRSLAYVAIQTRFALVSRQEWSRIDGGFDYSLFYWNIVSLFDNGAGDDLLQYFNHEIFGSVVRTSDTELAETATAKTVSSFERYQAQVMAKRAATAVNPL